jgi:hypothetical protein
VSGGFEVDLSALRQTAEGVNNVLGSWPRRRSVISRRMSRLSGTTAWVAQSRISGAGGNAAWRTWPRVPGSFGTIDVQRQRLYTRRADDQG